MVIVVVHVDRDRLRCLSVRERDCLSQRFVVFIAGSTVVGSRDFDRDFSGSPAGADDFESGRSVQTFLDIDDRTPERKRAGAFGQDINEDVIDTCFKDVLAAAIVGSDLNLNALAGEARQIQQFGLPLGRSQRRCT